MSRNPHSLRRTLAALACAPLVLAAPAQADTCAGLSLTALTAVGVGSDPSDVAVGDFNRDGLLDAAVVNPSSDNVSILLGNGLGGFTPGPGSPFSTGAATSPIAIAAGDLDQDGRLDLVVSYSTSPQARVLQGLGNGGFNVLGNFTINGIGSSRIYLADFTNDSDLDLVVLHETQRKLILYAGSTGTSFNLAALSDFTFIGPPDEQPAGAVPVDFDRDGKLDLAVVMRNNSSVKVYRGFGAAGLGASPNELASAVTGTGPRDVAAGDINRDGWIDLVTANSGSGSVSVLFNATAGTSLSSQNAVPMGGTPLRVALVDFDQDGILDLAADDSLTPRVRGFRGRTVGMDHFETPGWDATLPLPITTGFAVAVGDFIANGRPDLLALAPVERLAVAVENRSGVTCPRASFAAAPRSYLAAEGPVATAAADLDKDGRQDLLVATFSDSFLRVYRNVNGEFAQISAIGQGPVPPRAVAVGDLDADGDLDVVVARGSAGVGQVQVYLGDGMGGLSAGVLQSAGFDTAALVIADFNGDGAPDVVAASEGTGEVFRFLGNGTGGISVGTATLVGAGPRALVAGDFNLDGTLDVAVANSGAGNVKILRGLGDGSFDNTLPPLPVGAGPRGIAAAHLNGDTQLDLVTADFGSGQVSVLIGNGAGGYLVSVPYPVGASPTAVALVQLDGDPRPDIATSIDAAAPTLRILRNDGSGAFVAAGDSPLRQAPRAITLIDADTDGLMDLAVPCRDADGVVVLVNRPPGPPVLSAAPRFAAGDQPRGGVAADLDGDGDLDLAVPSSGSNVVSLLRNNGAGFDPPGTLAASQAEAVAVGDFNQDGKLDLAASAPGAGSVLVFLGTGGGAFAGPSPVAAGVTPDDLVAGDFDKDGDLDLAVCDKVTTGLVRILRNNGPGVNLGTFGAGQTIGVGSDPTAIVAGDFDRDGDLDLAVANNGTHNLMVLTNTAGTFGVTQTLGLDQGDQSPVSVAAGDFNGDGALDLAATAIFGDRVHVYRNNGAGTFVTPEGTFEAPAVIAGVSVADVNVDGKPDLLVAAGGLSVFRGRGGWDFDPPQSLVAAHSPVMPLAGDFNRDGRLDVAVVNEASDDVSVFTSNACQAQHLEVTVQPSACQLGSPVFLFTAEVRAFDDGGNPASCATNTIMPSIVPGTGGGGSLVDPIAPDVVALGLPLASGVASFSGSDSLGITLPGRRYRLQFQASGFPSVQSRSFTLGSDTTQIVGPASVCPNGFGDYSLAPDAGYDSYAWTLDGLPHSYNPVARLENPPIALNQFHTLSVTARVDGCLVTPTPPTLDVYFGDLASVTLSVLGGSTVCVDCIGGSAKAIETGGGVSTRQWGYRTTSTTGPITPIPGEVGETYVLKGANFPGPGTYYVVVTSTPACGLAAVSNEWTVTVEAGGGSGEVRHLAASSRGGSAPMSGQTKLLWINTTAPDEVRIRWNKAADGTTECVSPSSPTSPPQSPPDVDEVIISPVTANAKDSFMHAGLALDTAYCYSVFVRTGAAWSPGRTVKARPFDATTRPGHSVKWAYATGGSAVAPPTVSGEGILAMSNDRTVHALTRGPAGGDWPTNWTPLSLSGVAHSRSPVIPFTIPLGTADTVLFAADDTGFVHAIDAANGNRPWPAQGPVLSMTGAPGGIFTQWAGIVDGLLVGTRALTNNELRLLKLADGTLLEAYSGAGSAGLIGAINGSPAIDYATRRVYFASHQQAGGDTLFCVELAAAAPFFTWRWSRNLGDITGSPVLRGGRVIVGNDNGIVYSLDMMTGGDDHTYATLDGPVKGFLFPDRRNDDLIFATDTTVWSLSDSGSTMTVNWTWTLGGLNPSIVLYRPGTNYVYVGNRNGEIYELDFTSATMVTPPTHRMQVLGGGQGQVGAPSLDISRDLGPPETLLVGSEPGVVYALELPFPPP